MIEVRRAQKTAPYPVTAAVFEKHIQQASVFAKRCASPSEEVFRHSVDDTVARYKLVNHAADYDTAPAELFLSALQALSGTFVPRITFYDDAAKARLLFKKREYVVDYDYEDPAAVFVSTFQGDELVIQEGRPAELYAQLESLDGALS